MTLETEVREGKPGEVRLTECPFCEQNFEKDCSRWTSPAEHLRGCDEFHEAWGDVSIDD